MMMMMKMETSFSQVEILICKYKTGVNTHLKQKNCDFFKKYLYMTI